MVQTRKRFGQHFLEPVWADKVVQAIAPSPNDVFLEIGPGRGVLTLRLAPRIARLVAVEIDRDLVASLEPKLPRNATIVAGDVLEIDLARLLSDTVRLSAVAPVHASFGETRRSLGEGGKPDTTYGDAPLRIAGNLPYNVSSPILFKLLELQSERSCHDATLMLQREVAERIAAKPGTADYGVLTVLVQWQADVTRLLTLPPGAFRPPPAVQSALIRLVFRPPTFAVRDRRVFERLVRSMFTQRRKTLGNALRPFAADAEVDAREMLARAGIDPRRRPETLEIIEIARLADLFA